MDFFYKIPYVTHAKKYNQNLYYISIKNGLQTAPFEVHAHAGLTIFRLRLLKCGLFKQWKTLSIS